MKSISILQFCNSYEIICSKKSIASDGLLMIFPAQFEAVIFYSLAQGCRYAK